MLARLRSQGHGFRFSPGYVEENAGGCVATVQEKLDYRSVAREYRRQQRSGGKIVLRVTPKQLCLRTEHGRRAVGLQMQPSCPCATRAMTGRVKVGRQARVEFGYHGSKCWAATQNPAG